MQLIFWYNIAALYPVIAFGLPFGGPSLVLGSANVLITPLGAALLGLSLNEAAYMAEIIRGGIGSVDKGQYDAARALGMNGGKLMRRVILPQAMRVVLPPTGNQVISMLKGTSLVSVLAISDLLYSAQIIYSNNYQTIPLLIVASLWYLLMTTILSFFQNKLERRYGRGFDSGTATRASSSTRQGQHDEHRHGGSPGSPQELRRRRKSSRASTCRVERGSVTCLIGPSGSGKTTFLRCINHLEKVDAGRLYVDEHLVGYAERNGRLYEMKERQTARSRRDRGHGVPALQPLPAHDRAGEHHRSTRPCARPAPRAKSPPRPRPCWTASGSATAGTPTRRSSPAGSSSGSPSPGRWP